MSRDEEDTRGREEGDMRGSGEEGKGKERGRGGRDKEKEEMKGETDETKTAKEWREKERGGHERSPDKR